MRVLVTGADGFVGRHVVESALSAGHEVTTLSRATRTPHRGVRASWSADLTHEWPLDEVPDAVIHLASLAAVGRSFGDPQTYISANTAMLTTLAENLLAAGATNTRIVVASTGGLYAPGAGPCNEERELRMSSPYAVSKAAVELQAQYYRERGLGIVVARPFNHIGPGQAPGFLVPDLAGAVHDLGPREPLRVGNLQTRRDYTDVRDVARAYVELLSLSRPRPLYNIASGVSASGAEILSHICDALGVPAPETLVDESRLRPSDPHEIVGDASRIRDDLGWAPRIPIGQSIADFVHSRFRLA
ncbi:GDP-6-deoxy-D-mannose reductase [Microbacterium neimengense]